MRLSLDYFESLQRHAVPVDERAVAALAHSAMALDIYAWLAQRLHRVQPGKARVHPVDGAQGSIRLALQPDKEVQGDFRPTLDMVLSQYQGARLELDDRGMTLRNSPPPVKGRVALISKALPPGFRGKA